MSKFISNLLKSENALMHSVCPGKGSSTTLASKSDMVPNRAQAWAWRSAGNTAASLGCIRTEPSCNHRSALAGKHKPVTRHRVTGVERSPLGSLQGPDDLITHLPRESRVMEPFRNGPQTIAGIATKAVTALDCTGNSLSHSQTSQEGINLTNICHISGFMGLPSLIPNQSKGHDTSPHSIKPASHILGKRRRVLAGACKAMEGTRGRMGCRREVLESLEERVNKLKPDGNVLAYGTRYISNTIACRHIGDNQDPPPFLDGGHYSGFYELKDY